MNIKFLLVFFIYISYSSLFSQTYWEKTYNGTSAQYIEHAKDGNYLAIGAKGAQVYFMKINSSGEIIWEKEYGDEMASWKGYHFHETEDGGYILTGSRGGNSFLIRTDSNGNEIWKRNILAGKGYFVDQTFDDEFIVIGTVYILKTDHNGKAQWIKTFEGSWVKSATKTSDGGYIIIISKDYHIIMIKTDNQGNLIWTTNIKDKYDALKGNSILETSDKGFILAGEMSGLEIENFIYLIKTDYYGKVLWTKKIGERYTSRFSRSIKETTDTGYIITGYYYVNLLDPRVYLLKTDSVGEVLWEKIYDNDAPSRGYTIQGTIDGGCIIGGEKAGKMYIIKTNSTGGLKKNEIKVDNFIINQNYPNPFNSFTTIRYELKKDCYSTIKIYDVLGREIRTIERGEKKTGIYSTTWDSRDSRGEEVTSGVYFCKLRVDNYFIIPV